MKLTTIVLQAISRIITSDTTSLDDKLTICEKVTKIEKLITFEASIISKPLLQSYIRESIRQGKISALKRSDALFSKKYPDIDPDQCFSPHIRYPKNHNRVLLTINDRQPGMLKYLLDHGQNCNSEDDHQRTALMQAISNSDLESIAVLLEKKDINLNARSFYGSTALSLAIQKHDYPLVKLLLNHKNNINLNICLFAGHTALTLAMQQDDYHIVSLLCKDSRVNTQEQHFICFLQSGLLGHRFQYTSLMVAIQNRQWIYAEWLLPRSTQAEVQEISRLLDKHNDLTEQVRHEIERAKQLLNGYATKSLIHSMGSFLEYDLSSNLLTDMPTQRSDSTSNPVLPSRKYT